MNNNHDIIDDRIDVVSRGLLGLTVTCARCHDHKFDPVSMADYYSLHSVFANSVEPEVPPLFGAPPITPEYEAFRKELVLREEKLGLLIREKHQKNLYASKERLAEHLIFLQTLRGKPAQDDFMLLRPSSRGVCPKIGPPPSGQNHPIPQRSRCGDRKSQAQHLGRSRQSLCWDCYQNPLSPRQECPLEHAPSSVYRPRAFSRSSFSGGLAGFAKKGGAVAY